MFELENTSNNGAFIPKKWITAAIDLPCSGDGEVTGGLNLVGSGHRLPVIAQRKGIELFEIEALNNNATPLQQARISIKECEANKATQLVYSTVGYGADVVELQPTTNIGLKGIAGHAKPPKTKVEDDDTHNLVFGNYRAFLWWSLRTRFNKTFVHVNKIKSYPENELISIKNHATLIKELSTPLLIWENKKIYVESYSNNVESIDYANACVYAFAPNV